MGGSRTKKADGVLQEESQVKDVAGAFVDSVQILELETTELELVDGFHSVRERGLGRGSDSKVPAEQAWGPQIRPLPSP